MSACSVYSVKVPWSKVMVALCEADVSDEALEEVSSRHGLEALVLRLRGRPDPCEAALYLLYSREDEVQGMVRLRKRHLQALLYATRSRQLSEALSATRGGRVIVIASDDEGRLREAAGELGLSVGSPSEAACDVERLQGLASFRLQLLVG